jgi:hypothetical protein
MVRVITNVPTGEQNLSRQRTGKRYYARGSVSSPSCQIQLRVLNVLCIVDPKTLNDARAGIPVTIQRRFDVYPDVSKGS